MIPEIIYGLFFIATALLLSERIIRGRNKGSFGNTLAYNYSIPELQLHKDVDMLINIGRVDNPDLFSQITCRGIGCDGCCHQRVNITRSEGEFLVKMILEKKIKIDFDRLVKLAAYTEDGKEFWENIQKKDRACLFLKNGACSIYENRPAVCRHHNSLSRPSLCSHRKLRAVKGIMMTEVMDRIVSEGEIFEMSDYLFSVLQKYEGVLKND